MANQNTLFDLSVTPANNLNIKGQSQQGTAPGSTIDNIFQRYGAALKAFYDSLGGVATVSGTDTYTVTITEDWAAYASGLLLAIKPANANTGAATLNVTVPTAGVLGAKAIRRQGDSALSANDMVANGVYLLRYATSYNSSAGAWVLMNPASSSVTGVLKLDGTTTMTGDIVASTSTNVTTSPPLQFSGDANTGIGHSAADTIDFTVGGVNVEQITSTGARKSVIPSGSTLYPLFDCRAWVNFNGTGTVAIRASGNVSSITDNGVGDYTVNFTTAMADTNYAVVSSSWSSTFVSAAGPYSRSTSAVSVKTSSASGGNMQATTFADATDICLAVFR